MSSFDRHNYCTGGFDPDDIVLSGMSGRFPACKNIEEFCNGLFNKIDLTKEDTGGTMCPASANSIKYSTICGLDKLDSDFFGISRNLAQEMDPMHRKAIEVAYEAIVDAGYDPTCELKGANIGVYGCVTSEDAKEMRISNKSLSSTSAQTFLRTMLANRISYIFDFHGPSYTVDSACSTSFVAICNAFEDIREGSAEAAVIVAGEICICPFLSYYYQAAGLVSESCISCPFDSKSNGIIRGESITALFLQKGSAARRAYGTILHIKHASAGNVPEGIFVPSEKEQTKLFKEIMRQTGLTENDIDFVEAHGTGTPVGDPIEVKALENVFCTEDRKRPLYLGSVKSNIAHTEAASGCCGVIKVLLAFETGLIPPNYGYEAPNPKCTAIVEGRIQVLKEAIPVESPYIPVNCFGFGGSILSTILKRNPIESARETSTDLPRLVLFPAMGESAVQKTFDYITNHPDLKEEYFALLNKLSFTPVLCMPFRGYALYGNEEPRIHVKKILDQKREVWFVLTGMGCQWPGMGLEMMKIDAFAKSMRNSAEVLKSLGIDLFEILRKDSNHLMKDRSITPAFVSIAAIQIALVDVLTELEIRPDRIIGHSTGELVCAYADGCCSAEQTIISSYWRGKSVEGSDLVQGAMAAVGLTWVQATERCPKDVYPACHNAKDSVTISGLKEPVERFVEELQKENVFARIVNAYGYSFHCENIWPASNDLRDELNKVMTNPRERTDRWITTSYPEEELETDDCRFAGPEYFVHNLMSPVLFSDTLKKIPPNAITIEIGPHFLLQSILKRSIGKDSSYVGLMKRDDDDNVGFFFESLGRLYSEGLNPKIENLYPPVDFPVPRGTPIISNLIQWDYSATWNLPESNPTSGSYIYPISVDKTDKYLLDHTINGRPLFPATGYLYLAFQALAEKMEKKFEDLNIVVEDFKIHRATLLPKIGLIAFQVQILTNTKRFEISESNALVASGKVYDIKDPHFIEPSPTLSKEVSTYLSTEEVYNELRIYGYEYGPAFRRLKAVNLEGTEGFVEFNDWISFLDALLLFYMFSSSKFDFMLPTGLFSIQICPSILKSSIEECANQNLPGIPVNFYADSSICRTSGVEIRSLVVDPGIHHIKPVERIMEEYKFVPYDHCQQLPDTEQNVEKYMTACNKLVLKIEDSWKVDLKAGKFRVEGGNDFDVDSYINEFAEKNFLLGTLKNLSEKEKGDLNDYGKDFFSNFVKKVFKDPLNTVLFNDTSLRFMFEIILENTFRKLSIFELNKDYVAILPTVVVAVEKYSMIKFKSKTLVCKNEDVLDEHAVDGCNIQMIPYEKFVSSGIKNQNLVISSFIIGTEEEAREHVRLICSTVEEKGFVMLFHKKSCLPPEILVASVVGEKFNIVSETVMEEIFQTENLVIVSKISDKLVGNLYLLRHTATVKTRKLINMSQCVNWLDELKSGILESAETVWLLSEDCPHSGLIGMVNCLRNEPGGEKIRCIYNPDKRKMKNIPPFDFSEPFYKRTLETDLVMNVFKQNVWGSFKHIKIDTDIQSVEVNNAFVNVTKLGDLSSLKWIESALEYSDISDESLAHVYYSALNFRDLMLATGKITTRTAIVAESIENSIVGCECSGRLKNGRRVAGVCKSKGISTATEIALDFAISVPDKWSLEEAATIPVVYGTCYYALIMRGQLQPKQSILIHSGAGGIGLAAINVALSMNCEIFTTVGKDEKRQYLLDTFPTLKSENIGNSRSTSFEKMISKRTKGKGVDMVLNSLADDKFQASVRCIAKHGKFIEIGKYDLAMNHTLGLGVFLKNINFCAVYLDDLYDKNEYCKKERKILEMLMEEGIRNGVVKPLKRTVFQRDEVQNAFRYLGAGNHIGKVLIKIRDEEKEKLAIPNLLRVKALPVTYFYPHKVYIVVGGLGGFGIEVSNWMLRKGVRNLVLTSRYGARTPYHAICLNRWKNMGLNVVVSTRDVSIKEEAAELLKEVSQFGPVGGIFNSAVVLHDGFLDKISMKNFNDVCAPKANATQNLDVLSRCLCPELDHFVCFSSISCGRGNAGQMNYGYANSVMERICEQRHESGLPGLAIQWGIIGDVGVVHRHMGDDAMISGVVAQRVKSCLDTLDMCIKLQKPVVSSYVMNAAGSKTGGHKDVLQELATIFGFKDVSEINSLRSFSELGVDSMIGLEVKQLLESSLDTTFTLQELLTLTLDDVKKMLEEYDTKKHHESTSSALVRTTSNILPQSIFHPNPVEPLNDVHEGLPVFFMDIECRDLSQLQILAKALDRPVFALLWSKDTPTSSAEELAMYYLEKIKATSSQRADIVSISSASVPAFAMFVQNLKSQEGIQSLTILNGSSSLVKVASKEESTKDSDIDVISEFVKKYIPVEQKKLKDQLLNATSDENQIEIIVEEFSKTSSEVVNKTELSETVAVEIKKLLLLENYRPKMKLSNDILVVEDSTEMLANDIAETQALLSEICTGQISFQRINGIKNFEEDSVKTFVSFLQEQ